MIDRTATARIQRVIRWLEPCQRCFGHRAQRRALRTYVHGVFSDSDRKSMQAMLARVTQPVMGFTRCDARCTELFITPSS